MKKIQIKPWQFFENVSFHNVIVATMVINVASCCRIVLVPVWPDMSRERWVAEKCCCRLCLMEPWVVPTTPLTPCWNHHKPFISLPSNSQETLCKVSSSCRFHVWGLAAELNWRQRAAFCHQAFFLFGQEDVSESNRTICHHRHRHPSRSRRSPTFLLPPPPPRSPASTFKMYSVQICEQAMGNWGWFNRGDN